MHKTIYFLTENENKFKEASKILESNNLTLVKYPIDLDELQGTPEEIAIKKSTAIVKQLPNDKFPFITEDTSLHFNALGGMPGPYIKWFLKSTGLIKINEMLSFSNDRSATAQCIVTYIESKNSKPKLFIGTVNGRIVMPRGPDKFGWDPIFEPDIECGGNWKTFAELDPDTKNMISHRSNAFKKLKEYLEGKNDHCKCDDN